MQQGFTNWKFGGKKSTKTISTEVGSGSVSEVRHAVQKDMINYFRIESFQYYSKKDYLCIKLNMEWSLTNSKELQNVLGKAKNVFVALMINGFSMKENISVDFSKNAHGITGLRVHYAACDYSIAEDVFDVSNLVKGSTSSYYCAK